MRTPESTAPVVPASRLVLRALTLPRLLRPGLWSRGPA